MTSEDHDGPPTQGRVTWEFNWTTIIAFAIALLSTVAGATYHIADLQSRLRDAEAANRRQEEDARREIARLQESYKQDNVRLAQSMSDLRSEVKEGLGEVRAQVATLPDMRASLTHIQQTNAQEQVRWSEWERRDRQAGELMYQLRTRIDQLERSSGQPLAVPRLPR